MYYVYRYPLYHIYIFYEHQLCYFIRLLQRTIYVVRSSSFIAKLITLTLCDQIVIIIIIMSS